MKNVFLSLTTCGQISVIAVDSIEFVFHRGDHEQPTVVGLKSGVTVNVDHAAEEVAGMLVRALGDPR